MKPYSILQIILKYLRHQWHARGRHGIHSPFVFDFYEKVVKISGNRQESEAFAPIYREVTAIKRNSGELTYTDPSSGVEKRQTIGDIARKSAKNHRLGKLLGHSVNYFKPAKALELGTSLGISAAYQQALHPPALFHTIEANRLLSPVSAELWRELNGSIELMEGYFEEILPDLLQKHNYDWIFIDGNHQYAATLRYFELLKKHTSRQAVLVFDDIHWSADMESAWKEIIADPEVTISLDLFFLGFVFRSPEYTKETFKLRL